MARETSGVGDLDPKSQLTDVEIEAVTTTELQDATAEPFTFSTGHDMDVAEAIEMRSQAKSLRAETDTAPGLRRTLVKTAAITDFPRPK